MELKDTYKDELLNSIPIVSGMKVDIESLSEHEVCLSAPLATNSNYEGTAFGGSLNTLCILSAYLLTHHIMKSNQLSFKSLVIQNSKIDYLHPVESDFIAKASCSLKNSAHFKSMLEKKSIARIEIESQVTTKQSEKICVIFKGRFVASN
jgi:thioesterase domain-containing protein